MQWGAAIYERSKKKSYIVEENQLKCCGFL